MKTILRTAIAHEKLAEIVAIQRDVAHTHHDLQGAMNLIAERTRTLTGADSAVIEMLEGDEMVYHAASGLAAKFLGMRIKAQGSLSGLCVQENTVLRCDDSETDSRVDKEACRTIGVTSMLVLPLTRGKKAVGVLKVLSSQVAAFNEQHVLMLEILTGVLSAAFGDAIVHETLRQSEEIFRNSMEHSPIGMALVTPDGHWFKVNKSLCALLGYSVEELTQLDFRAVTHPDDIRQSDTIRNDMIAGTLFRHEYQKRYIHRDGRTIWVQVYVSLVRDMNGSPLYFIAQIEDITTRREVERLKNEFISVVSHELRTPLTSIHGSLGLVKDDGMGKLPEEASALINIAYRNSKRLVLLINDILDIEKIESGNLTLSLEPISVVEFLDSAVEMNQAYAMKNGVRFVIESCVSGRVMADGDRLMQIMTNLLSNASKFSHGGSVVALRVSRNGDFFHFEVEDHGSGIPEDFHTRIFGKFTQSDGSNTRKHEGTGLGLNITKRLVEMMHGKIGFTSAEGRGTTFYFDLPEAV